MATPASYKGVLKRYEVSTNQVQQYFAQLPSLLRGFSV